MWLNVKKTGSAFALRKGLALKNKLELNRSVSMTGTKVKRCFDILK
jgi:hypothetical protein